MNFPPQEEHPEGPLDIHISGNDEDGFDWRLVTRHGKIDSYQHVGHTKTFNGACDAMLAIIDKKEKGEDDRAEAAFQH